MIDVISKICEVHILCLNHDYCTDLCPLSIGRPTVWTDVRSIGTVDIYVYLVGTIWTCVRSVGRPTV